MRWFYIGFVRSGSPDEYDRFYEGWSFVLRLGAAQLEITIGVRER